MPTLMPQTTSVRYERERLEVKRRDCLRGGHRERYVGSEVRGFGVHGLGVPASVAV
jgi:hypothetical protein